MDYYGADEDHDPYYSAGRSKSKCCSFATRWRNDKNPQQQLQFAARILFGTSLFFWGWAIFNTMTMLSGSFDLGIVSFLTVMLSSAFLLVKTSGTTTSIGWKSRICITFSYIVVFLNYSLGILFALTAGSYPYYYFGTYCAVAMILWFSCAIFMWKLIGRNITVHASAGNGGSSGPGSELDDLYDFRGGGGGSRGGSGYPY